MELILADGEVHAPSSMKGMSSRRARPLRIVLWVLLGVAVAVLIVVSAVLIPILMHQSAGASGQRVPDAFVASSTAQGDDGRTRELSVATVDGEAADLSAIAPGDTLVVTGSGYDDGIGIYVSICKIPESSGERPTPCLGGIPEGAMEGEIDDDTLSSQWITNDWAWRAFATGTFDDGSFTTKLLVPNASQEGLDCTVERCAIVTRADHTASSDRVQDMLLPVRFSG